jgi:nucleotide-binding universal stress UspA family protein
MLQTRKHVSSATKGEFTMRSLAVNIDGSENDANSLKFAVALARDSGMRLTVYHKLQDKVIVGGFDPVAIPIDNTAAADDARKRAETAYKSEVANLPGARFLEVDTDAATLIRTQSTYHDLLLIERLSDAEGPDGADLNGILWDAGSPVVVVPPTLKPGPIRKVAIAWNGSLPAARALKAVLNLLNAEADIVFLVRAGTEKDEEIGQYMACRGRTIDGWKTYGEAGLSARGFARALLSAAEAEKADLLAVGAHGGFFGFGRATAKIATAATIPVLFSA